MRLLLSPIPLRRFLLHDQSLDPAPVHHRSSLTTTTINITTTHRILSNRCDRLRLDDLPGGGIRNPIRPPLDGAFSTATTAAPSPPTGVDRPPVPSSDAEER